MLHRARVLHRQARFILHRRMSGIERPVSGTLDTATVSPLRAGAIGEQSSSNSESMSVLGMAIRVYATFILLRAYYRNSRAMADSVLNAEAADEAFFHPGVGRRVFLPGWVPKDSSAAVDKADVPRNREGLGKDWVYVDPGKGWSLAGFLLRLVSIETPHAAYRYARLGVGPPLQPVTSASPPFQPYAARPADAMGRKPSGRKVEYVLDGEKGAAWVSGVGSPTVVLVSGTPSAGAELQRKIARTTRCVLVALPGLTGSERLVMPPKNTDWRPWTADNSVAFWLRMIVPLASLLHSPLLRSSINSATLEPEKMWEAALQEDNLALEKTPRAKPLTSGRTAKAISGALEAADVDDDVLVVSTDYNWLGSMAFAGKNASSVRGVVLVDPLLPGPELRPTPEYPRALAPRDDVRSHRAALAASGAPPPVTPTSRPLSPMGVETLSALSLAKKVDTTENRIKRKQLREWAASPPDHWAELSREDLAATAVAILADATSVASRMQHVAGQRPPSAPPAVKEYLRHLHPPVLRWGDRTIPSPQMAAQAAERVQAECTALLTELNRRKLAKSSSSSSSSGGSTQKTVPSSTTTSSSPSQKTISSGGGATSSTSPSQKTISSGGGATSSTSPSQKSISSSGFSSEDRMAENEELWAKIVSSKEVVPWSKVALALSAARDVCVRAAKVEHEIARTDAAVRRLSELKLSERLAIPAASLLHPVLPEHVSAERVFRLGLFAGSPFAGEGSRSFESRSSIGFGPYLQNIVETTPASLPYEGVAAAARLSTRVRALWDQTQCLRMEGYLAKLRANRSQPHPQLQLSQAVHSRDSADVRAAESRTGVGPAARKEGARLALLRFGAFRLSTAKDLIAAPSTVSKTTPVPEDIDQFCTAWLRKPTLDAPWTTTHEHASGLLEAARQALDPASVDFRIDALVTTITETEMPKPAPFTIAGAGHMPDVWTQQSTTAIRTLARLHASSHARVWASLLGTDHVFLAHRPDDVNAFLTEPDPVEVADHIDSIVRAAREKDAAGWRKRREQN